MDVLQENNSLWNYQVKNLCHNRYLRNFVFLMPFCALLFAQCAFLLNPIMMASVFLLQPSFDIWTLIIFSFSCIEFTVYKTHLSEVPIVAYTKKRILNDPQIWYIIKRLATFLLWFNKSIFLCTPKEHTCEIDTKQVV